MGSLTHTVGGSDNLVNFKSAARVPIESLKCHFLPVQEGSGDPSPDNIRPIIGWNSSKVYTSGKNIGHVVGYSAKSNESPTSTRYSNGNYGNSISTKNYEYPDTPVTITQTQWPNDSNVTDYRNGYFTVVIDNLMFGEIYDFSFKVSDITNNPLNVSLSQIQITNSKGTSYRVPSEIVNENTLIFNNVPFTQNASMPNRSEINIYYCGMSCTISEFMVTPANKNDGIFEPYCGNIIPVTFPLTGKNLFDPTNTVSGWIRAYWVTEEKPLGSMNDDNSWRTSDYVPVVESTVYTLTVPKYTAADAAGLVFFQSNTIESAISGVSTYVQQGATYTFTTPSNCHYIRFSWRAGEGDNAQLELGDTATSYEPYSSDNTFYGGYVDIAAGTLTATYKTFTAKISDYSEKDEFEGINAYRFYNFIPERIIRNNTQMCSIAPYSWSSNTNLIDHFYAYTSDIAAFGSTINLYLLTPVDETQEFTVVVPLETPIHYPISKQQLKTFLSNNSIWSNTNDVTEVSYALHDAGPIRASKRRIAMNQPHVETATGNAATFNTDMIADIKSAKAYFTATQSANGYNYPWHGGGGKNLITSTEYAGSFYTPTIGTDLKGNSTRSSYTVNSNTITVTTTSDWYGCVFATGLLQPATYIVHMTADSNLRGAVFVTDEYLVSTETATQYSGTSINQTITLETAGRIAVYIGCGAARSTVASDLQVEKGSSYTSWVPYENICPITEWSGLNSWKTGKNIAHIFGYSATNISTLSSTRKLTNNYGTTISTTDFTGPDTPLVITQSQAPMSGAQRSNYMNGYFAVCVDNIIFERRYEVSFKVSNITSNLLNLDISEMRLYSPNSGAYPATKNGDYLIFRNVLFNQNASNPQRSIFEIRNCGISFTMSEFMVTEVGEEDRTFEPYSGVSIPYLWSKNLLNVTADNLVSFSVSGNDNFTLNNGTFNITGNALVAVKVKCKPSTQYTFSCTKSGIYNMEIVAFTSEPTVISNSSNFIATGNFESKTFITPADATWLTCGFFVTEQQAGEGMTVSNLQLELGSSATSYEEYFEPVYSGNVDLVSGVLTIDRKAFTKKISDYSTKAEYNTGINCYRFLNCVPEQIIRNNTQICTIAKYAWEGANVLSDHFYADFSSNSYYGSNLLLYLLTPVDETQEFTVVVPLETPITYQLTPHQLKTLRGANNIWSDANGNVEVKYWKH